MDSTSKLGSFKPHRLRSLDGAVDMRIGLVFTASNPEDLKAAWAALEEPAKIGDRYLRERGEYITLRLGRGLLPAAH